MTVAVNTTTGIATFSGLAIDKIGTGYTLTATGSTVNTTPGVVVSNGFNITVGPAAKLAFTTQPGNGTPVRPWSTQPAVTVAGCRREHGDEHSSNCDAGHRNQSRAAGR